MMKYLAIAVCIVGVIWGYKNMNHDAADRDYFAEEPADVQEASDEAEISVIDSDEAESTALPESESDIVDINFSIQGKLVPYYGGIEDSAVGAYVLMGLKDENGNVVTRARFTSIAKEKDSYGYPMWICEYANRGGTYEVSFYAEDGSWEHHFNDYISTFYIDEYRNIHVNDAVYAIGNELSPPEIIGEKEINYYKPGDSDFLYAVECDEWELPDLPEGCEKAGYVGCGGEPWRAGREVWKVHWDGNIFAEQNGNKYLYDSNGNEMFHGQRLDMMVDDAHPTHVYYSALCGDQLRLYDYDGSFLTNLRGAVVLGIYDGTVYSMGKTHGIPVEAYDLGEENEVFVEKIFW